MLLQFSVANNLSLRSQQDLSLVASSLKDVETGLIKSHAMAQDRILPAAVIYGANASGKSNVVVSLRDMQSIVRYSHSKGEPGGKIPRTPFALEPKCASAPTAFSLDFVLGEVRYHYGFEFYDESISSEWLYTYPRNRRQLLFEREGMSFKFGRELRGQNKVISELTRPNSLFLSAAAQNDHEQLSEVAGYFRAITIDTDVAIEAGLASLHLAAEDVDTRVVRFLDKLETGVFDYRKRETEMPERTQEIQRAIRLALKNIEGVDFEFPERNTQTAVELAHRGHDGKPVYFELARESAGTRRLLMLLGRVFHALDKGVPMIVDELDASLHTQACETVLALFSSPTSNPKGAQLIATTHDNNLLSSPLLRRDQVWFTEKDAEGATHLYPLTDIRTRKGDNIEKGYLQGRYGAVPYSGSISDLIEAG